MCAAVGSGTVVVAACGLAACGGVWWRVVARVVVLAMWVAAYVVV